VFALGMIYAEVSSRDFFWKRKINHLMKRTWWQVWKLAVIC